MKVTVIGTDEQGLELASCLAVNHHSIALVANKGVGFSQFHLDLIESHALRLVQTPSESVTGSEIVIVCGRNLNMLRQSGLLDVVEGIRRELDHGTVLVIRAALYPEVLDDVIKHLRRPDVVVVANPNFLSDLLSTTSQLEFQS